MIQNLTKLFLLIEKIELARCLIGRSPLLNLVHKNKCACVLMER